MPNLLWILLLLSIGSSEQRNGRNNHHQHTIFRYQCPPGNKGGIPIDVGDKKNSVAVGKLKTFRCLCVPDVVDVEMVMISCKWEGIEEHSFSNQTFPKNATKSLSIQCQGSEQRLGENLFAGFDELRELRISNCHLRQLMESTFLGLPKLRALHLNHIGPVELNTKAFHHLSALEKLTLADSGIENIPRGVLCSLRFLQILNVSSNKISNARLGVDTSECVLDHLIILNLGANRIKHVSSFDFNPFPSLRQLSLAANSLRGMDVDAFRTVNLIQHLDLDHNHLREIVQLPDSLFHLNLAHNHLSIIPSSVANLPSLVSLDLSHNSIPSSTPFSFISNSIEFLDLSGNQLTSIPTRIFRDSTDTMTELKLANNEISEVEPFLLQNFTHLKNLDLSNNRIKSLSFGIFSGLGELANLQMNNNSLYFVDVEVFSDLSRRLLTLGMANNLLTELPMAIGRLSRIHAIDLSHNQISKAYKFVLNKISHLTRLNLSRNNLNSIESYVFSDSAQLAGLDLSWNGIEAMSTDAFEKCPKLKVLDLSGNRLSTFSGALREVGSLRVVNVSENMVERLEWEEFGDGLEELYAGGNQIQRMSEAGAEMGVKVLDLHRNQLRTLNTNHLPPVLEQLNLSTNSLPLLSNSTFLRQTQLKSIDLTSNQLHVVPASVMGQSEVISPNFPGLVWLSGNPLDCDCQMGWILRAPEEKPSLVVADFSSTNCLLPLLQERRLLNNTNPEDFLCPYTQTCEPNCICCQYGNCDCKSRCPEGCDCFHDSSFKTNVVKCHTPKSKQQFTIKELPMHASHIFLSGLELPVLRSHDFMGRTRLTQLHVTSSNLRTIQPLAFNTLPKLKTLDLSNNKLQKINGDEAFKTQRIHKLNLQQNELTEIDPRLAEIMPNLELLLLDNNLFEDLPEYLVTKAAEEKLATVSLGKNPFRCDCSHNQRFQAQGWLSKRSGRERVLDINKVYCVENVTRAFELNDTTILSGFAPNLGDDIFTMPMLDFLQQENRSICVMKSEGFFGGSAAHNAFFILFLVAFVALLIVGVLYLLASAIRNGGKPTSRNRYQKANSLNFSSSDTANCSSPLAGPLIQFDVFISYSKKDEEMVIQQYCRPLEAQDFTLCLLHQDGPSSRYNGGLHSVSDELIRQLEVSHTLIVVLTKNFLEHEWRTVQIKTSHQLFAKMKNKKLIAIIGEDVSQNELESELGQILRKNTCIAKSHHLFWNLLMSSLPRRESPVASETSQIYSEYCYGSVQVPSEVV